MVAQDRAPGRRPSPLFLATTKPLGRPTSCGGRCRTICTSSSRSRPRPPGEVLAVLIGVNAGPNLTYAGSLATLLWRRALRQRGEELPALEFLRLGAMTVPPVLLAATLALWTSLRLVG